MKMILLFLFCIVLFTIPAFAQKAGAKKQSEKTQALTVTLTDKGYQPERLKLQRGVPARITFVRKFEATCATEIIIPKYNIKRDLPMNDPVVVEFTPEKSGEVDFTCSMKMVGGKITVN